MDHEVCAAIAITSTREKGYFAKKLLFVNVQEAVLKLIKSGRILRKKVSGLFLPQKRSPVILA